MCFSAGASPGIKALSLARIANCPAHAVFPSALKRSPFTGATDALQLDSSLPTSGRLEGYYLRWFPFLGNPAMGLSACFHIEQKHGPWNLLVDRIQQRTIRVAPQPYAFLQTPRT